MAYLLSVINVIWAYAARKTLKSKASKHTTCKSYDYYNLAKPKIIRIMDTKMVW